MLVATGRFGALEELYGKGIQVLSVHPQAAVSDSFVPLNNLGALYDKGGAYRQRDKIFSAIIARADALTAPIDEKTARLFIELARFFESAGHTKPVAILYRHLQRFAISTPLDPEARRHLIHSYGKALAAEGQHQAALDMYRESHTAIEAASELADHDRVAFLFLMGGAARAAGDLAQAQSLLEQARDVAERTQAETPEAGIVYHTLAMVYLDRRERYDEAERLLERTSAIAAQTSGEDSAEYAGSRAQLAVLVDSRGDPSRAISLYREAFRVYESAPAPNPAEHADFLSDAGDLYLRLGRHEDALAAFLRALQLRQSIPKMGPSVLAFTMANLATAHFELGDLPEAIRWHREAVDLWYRPSTFPPRPMVPEASA